MDDVILDELGPFQQIAQDPGVVRDGDAQSVFNCPHGADGVNGRSNPADPLGEQPGIAGVAALEHQLESPEHHP